MDILLITILSVLTILGLLFGLHGIRKYKRIMQDGIVVTGRIIDFHWVNTYRTSRRIYMTVEYTVDDTIKRGTCSILRVGFTLPFKNEKRKFIYMPEKDNILFSLKRNENLGYHFVIVSLLISCFFLILLICIILPIFIGFAVRDV